MMSVKKIIVSAGGTGGHIIPALSVCKELLKRDAEVYYIGNKNSMESEIISKNDISFYPINVQKLYRSLTIKHLLFPFKLAHSIALCLKYFRQIKPDAFVGFGGFVAGAPAVTAWLCRCPIYLQEQNCKPGLTNRITGKFAKAVFLAYEESVKYFGKTRSFVTGNPVQMPNTDAFFTKSVNKGETKTLFILGGSQGSMFINNLILKNLRWFAENNIDLIWQTGKRHLQDVRSQIVAIEAEHALFKDESIESRIVTFDFTDKIHKYYEQADYVISRGGALSLAEIEIYKISAFVIPLSTAAVNEQYHNARNLQNRNMGMMFEEKDKDLFIEKFKEFVAKVPGMYDVDETSLHLTAADTIAKILLETK